MRARILVVLLSLALLGLAGSTLAVAAGAKPLDAETLWQIQRLGAPSISPDGRYAVLPVTKPDMEEDTLPADLYVVALDGSGAKPLTTHEANDSSPIWSPDGSAIAFVSKRGDDEAAQLYVISTSGGEARRVTDVPTGVSAPRWFADGKRIAFISRAWADLEDWDAQQERLKEREESKVSAQVWDKAPIRWWDHWLDDKQPHVYAVTLESGEVSALTLGSGRHLPVITPGRGHYDISPDGTRIAFVSDSDKTGVDSNYDVFVMEIGSNEARNITTANNAGDSAPLFSPDGRHVAFQRQKIKGFYADKTRLVVKDLSEGAERVLTEDWDRSVSGLVWAPDGSALFGAIDDAGNRRVYRIDARSGKATPITKGMSFASLDVSLTGTMVGLRQGFTEPPTLVTIDTKTGEATKVSDFNDAVLAGVDFGTYESVTYKGAKGDEIQMWINYPPGFDKSRKYPLYLLLHGGPHNGVTDSFHWRWNAQVFSGWGYVTAWHNFHGSSGFGQAFTDSINPDRATMPYEDTIAAAEWFAKQPWIDADRLSAGGGSYGGYLASILLGREHPFKTLVAHAAVYNSFTQYGADYGAGKRRHGEFWESLDTYLKVSPHMGAANFETPTLVIHGQLDYRVPVNQGFELFAALQNRGVRSRMIYYPDENHWILKPQNSLHWYEEVRKWIAEFAPPGGAG
jgi:dipeptidyl aminopeptidase/acylaminoacyl peptidase